MKLGSGYHMINSNNSEGGDDRDWGMGHIASRVSAAVSILYSNSGLADCTICFDICRFLLFSLLLGPFMWLFNRLTDKIVAMFLVMKIF